MRELLKLKRLIQPYWKEVLIMMGALAGVTLSQLAIPAIIQKVIDVGLFQGDIRIMINAALLIVGIGVLRALFTFWQRYYSEKTSMLVAYDMRNILFNTIQHESFTFHDHAQTGQLMSRCTEDVGSVQRFIGFGGIELLQTALMMVGTLGIMFFENSNLTLIAIIPIIPLVLQTTRFGGRASELFYTIDKALGTLSTRLQENVSGVQVVRAFSREDYEIGRFERANRDLYDARIHVIQEWAKVMPTSSLLVSISTILILWFGGQQVLAGSMTVGQIAAFNGYLLLLASPAQQLVWLVNTAGEAAAGLQRAFEVIDHEPIIKDPVAIKAPAERRGEVIFKNVSFTYGGEDGPALRDINLHAHPDETIALIGPTGSGKSTLINLIPRFYDVSEGSVKVDGLDVREQDLVALRQDIGIVLQTSLLFSATIQENIALGRPNASKEEIEAAAKSAQAHDFIIRTPKGYETVVGERGITLSGGQRQRIAIARALLIDPSILILDDATSSVDTETEHLIQKALDTLMAGRTTFVIAQRLSTLKDADQILVLDEGRIVERGQHDDLVKTDGLYKEIYDLQLAQQDQFKEELNMLKESGDD